MCSARRPESGISPKPCHCSSMTVESRSSRGSRSARISVSSTSLSTVSPRWRGEFHLTGQISVPNIIAKCPLCPDGNAMPCHAMPCCHAHARCPTGGLDSPCQAGLVDPNVVGLLQKGCADCDDIGGRVSKGRPAAHDLSSHLDGTVNCPLSSFDAHHSTLLTRSLSTLLKLKELKLHDNLITQVRLGRSH